ncbi:MAG: glutathione S-transferase family protein, partial [Pseudomonadota bacterium]
MAKPLLITLLPSSGVDLSRWLMAHYRIDYTERPHAPIFHLLALKYWGADTYPLLVQDGGKTKTGSCESIVALLDPQAPANQRLLPDPQTEAALAKQVDDTVKYAYWEL